MRREISLEGDEPTAVRAMIYFCYHRTYTLPPGNLYVVQPHPELCPYWNSAFSLPQFRAITFHLEVPGTASKYGVPYLTQKARNFLGAHVENIILLEEGIALLRHMITESNHDIPLQYIIGNRLARFHCEISAGQSNWNDPVRVEVRSLVDSFPMVGTRAFSSSLKPRVYHPVVLRCPNCEKTMLLDPDKCASQGYCYHCGDVGNWEEQINASLQVQQAQQAQQAMGAGVGPQPVAIPYQPRGNGPQAAIGYPQQGDRPPAARTYQPQGNRPLAAIPNPPQSQGPRPAITYQQQGEGPRQAMPLQLNQRVKRVASRDLVRPER